MVRNEHPHRCRGAVRGLCQRLCRGRCRRRRRHARRLSPKPCPQGQGGGAHAVQHDPKEPVGIWENIAEDGFGLWVEGRLVPGVARSDELRRLIATRAIDGLSIGFRTVRASRERGSRHRRLHEIDLWEISIVTFPMMAGARIAPGTGTPERNARQDGSLRAAISLLRGH